MRSKFRARLAAEGATLIAGETILCNSVEYNQKRVWEKSS